MGGWMIWIGSAATVALVFLTTLHLVLRGGTRSRLADQFERKGWTDQFEAFVTTRHQYTLAVAAARSAAVLILFVSVIQYFETIPDWPLLARTLVACLVAWVLALVFGVAIPHALAKYAGEPLTVSSLPLLKVLRIAGYPVVTVLQWFDPFIRRLAGAPEPDARSHAEEMEQEILETVNEGMRVGAVDKDEQEMIESVIELADSKAVEVMTPRTDIVALACDADLPSVLHLIQTTGYSRIPVFEESLDGVIGVLYAKDLLFRHNHEPFSLSRIMRPAFFVPESKSVRTLLREFQARKVHLAIVLDEYGGTSGLVTIEDILEELVGEITDEYEPSEPPDFRQVDERTFEVDARMRIEDFVERFPSAIPQDKEYDTVGGFLCWVMGRIPETGESLAQGPLTFEVLDADPLRVRRLRVQRSLDGQDAGNPTTTTNS